MTKAELLNRLSDIEWDDFEVKEARSELPKNIWETVSAFSNTSGGWIVFGVSKKAKKFDILGVKNTEKQEQDFTTVLRSRNKFNGVLTYGGLLTLGNEDSIKKIFSSFWIDYLEIPGISYSDAKTRYTFRIQEQENIWEYYNVLIQRLRNYTDNPFHMGDNGFAYEDDSQLDALREGLVNMLMHADYFSTIHSTIRVFDNRIVFQNPGRFDINISQWHKNAISKPRNPVIARMFRWAKLAENAGFGYDKMLTWKHKVEFDTNIDYSEATFYLSEKVVKNTVSQKIVEETESTPPITPPITELEKKLLDSIGQNPKGNIKDYAVKLGISEGVVKEYIAKLKQKGILERIGNNRTGYWVINN